MKKGITKIIELNKYTGGNPENVSLERLLNPALFLGMEKLLYLFDKEKN